MAIHAVQRRNREMLAVCRRWRELCRQILPGGEELGPRRMLAAAGIRPQVSREDLGAIPASGPVLAVADGGAVCVIESLAAAELFRKTRPGAKVLAGHFLAKAPGLSSSFIPYDRRQRRPAASGNLRAMFAALAHLRSGGLLAAFPADERAPRTSSGNEPGWAAAVRIARLSGAAIVPVSFACTQAQASVFPGASVGEVEMRVGAPLDPQRLAAFASDEEAGSYLRWKTTLLARRREPPVRLVPRIFPLPGQAGHLRLPLANRS
jgi:hypothetical protein